MRKVVITGLGPVTPIGIGKDEFWSSLLLGQSNYSEITKFKLEEWDKIRIAAEIKHFDMKDHLDKFTLKAIQRLKVNNGGLRIGYTMAGAKLALNDAGLDLNSVDLERVGVYVGSGKGNIDLICDGQFNFTKGAITTANSLPAIIAKELNLHGTTRFVSAACATGCVALDEGLRRIEQGSNDVMIVGSVETPISHHYLGSELDRRKGTLGLSSRNKPMVPFSEGRDGPILSEGAGILVIEEEEHAKKRGAHIYARIAGTGDYTIFDENLVQICEQGYLKAMTNALRNTGVNPDGRSIYVNAHGTATELNDRLESEAIRKVFGNKVPVSSFKGTTGHPQAASAGFELIGCALTLDNKVIPPTNLEVVGTDCAQLDYVTDKREVELDYIVKNSAGFGGVYCTVLLERFE